jgi:elongation factor P hydroxylase
MRALMNSSMLNKKTTASDKAHRYQDIIHLFNNLFAISENTRLVKGKEEPIYLPAKEPQDFHQIVFAHGYFASALHEIAHWCIASKERRLKEDYGYWYCPDGRDSEQQKEFERVEIKPQAIEWAFSIAANKPFSVSTDNLNGASPNTLAFHHNVHLQALHYLRHGFPQRAQQFIHTLQRFYSSPNLCEQDFSANPTQNKRIAHAVI